MVEQKPDIKELLEDIEMHVSECEMSKDGKCDVKQMYSMLWDYIEKSLKRDELQKEIEQLFRERIKVWGRISLSERESQETLKKLEALEEG